MWTTEFWKAVAERAVSTFAQTLMGVLGVGATSLLSVDWQAALSTAALAAVLSVLKSLIASKVGNGGPSFGPEQLTHEPEKHGRHERPDAV